MLTALGFVMAILVPALFVAGLLRLADRVQRGRAEIAARQIAVTDAIHRELGAVVAPTVQKRPLRPWRLVMAVPFARPDTVSAVLTIAHRVDPSLEILVRDQGQPCRRTAEAA